MIFITPFPFLDNYLNTFKRVINQLINCIKLFVLNYKLIFVNFLPDPNLSPVDLWTGSEQESQYPDLLSSILMGYGNDRFRFPHNCNINVYDQEVAAGLIQPPINIPYCVRYENLPLR